MNCRKRITWNSIHMEQHSRQFNIIHPLYVRSDVSLTSNHTWNRNTNKSNKCHKMIQQWYKKCVIKEVLLSTEHTHNNNNKTDSSDRWEPTAKLPKQLRSCGNKAAQCHHHQRGWRCFPSFTVYTTEPHRAKGVTVSSLLPKQFDHGLTT